MSNFFFFFYRMRSCCFAGQSTLNPGDNHSYTLGLKKQSLPNHIHPAKANLSASCGESLSLYKGPTIWLLSHLPAEDLQYLDVLCQNLNWIRLFAWISLWSEKYLFPLNLFAFLSCYRLKAPGALFWFYVKDQQKATEVGWSGKKMILWFYWITSAAFLGMYPSVVAHFKTPMCVYYSKLSLIGSVHISF